MPIPATVAASPNFDALRFPLGPIAGTADRTGAPSDRIGPYRVLQRIGRGGFSVVYKGFDDRLQRTVAIKLCTDSDPKVHRGFRQEAEIGGLLDHPAFPQLYDTGFHDHQPYLVQEYLRGQDLVHLIRRREPHVLVEKLDILLQVVRGLAHAHSLGVTHCDIKPGNIKVLDSGRVKILDFGAARLDQVEASPWEAGMLMGTPAYLAPEQIGGHPAGTPSDVFSFGVLAYELVAFRHPFKSMTIDATFHRLLHLDPTPLTRVCPECPAALAEVVHTCLSKDPGGRYGSFELLEVELARIQAQRIAALGAGSRASRGLAVRISTPAGGAERRGRRGWRSAPSLSLGAGAEDLPGRRLAAAQPA